MFNFSAFRINLIVPEKRQISLFPDERTKEQIFKDQIINLRKEQKQPFFSHGTRFIMFYNKELSKTIHLLSLAKEEVYTKPIEKEKSIENIKDKRTPYVYVIIDEEKQIILVQDKTSVFSYPDAAKNRLEDYFIAKLNQTDISPSIKE